MEKKDMMYLAAALMLVLVIALVIKPLATGQPIKTGMPVPTTTIPISTLFESDPSVPSQISLVATTRIPTLVPTPIPTWNPNSSKEVPFVDPSNYGISFNSSIPQGTRFNESFLDTNMTTIATIASVRSPNVTQLSGTTQIMYMPFPYWELEYTVAPSDPLKPATIEITPSLGQGLAYSGVSGSYSTNNPQFTIQVMDGDDPNRIVRTISPPGGINLDLWMGVEPTTKENSNYRTNQRKTVVPTPTSVDPRPWTEKFYEGQRNYYFIITTQSLDSYTIKIKVPSRYIGKY
jgi:hypothetical protein